MPTTTRRRRRLLAVGVAALAALAASAPSALAASPAHARHDGPTVAHRPHVMPYRPGGARTASAPAGAHLTYNGGRVVGAMHVVQVVYGTGTYLSQTTATGSASVHSFYASVLQSQFMTWLNSEYKTTGTSYNGTSSNQTIGLGSAEGPTTITPSAANNGSSITDAQVQAEITAQIQAGHLPAPQHDAAGNPTTYYSVFFRHGQSICDASGSCSLVAGGFCAYHGTVAASGSLGEYYYAVQPDLTGVAGCGNSTDFANTTSVASHEMTETITDAEVGLAGNGNGPPLAWYDNTNGEIGDICNGQQATWPGTDGVTYTVQQEFSNAQSNCITPPSGAASSDFTLSASPTAVSVAAGGTTTATVSTGATSPSESVGLSVSGVPAGVTASVSPTSVTSGGSATLTITASASAAPTTATLTITGTATSGTHTTTVTVTVTSAAPPPTTGVTNGGFETGSFSGWTTSGAASSVVSSGAHGGTYAARLGSTSPTNGDSSAAQTFTAPTGSSQLSFWYKVTCPDTVTYDWATATLKDVTTGTTTTVLAKTCVTAGAWTQVTSTITAGHSYTLTLTSHDDNYSGDPTYTLYDDVATA